MAFPFVLALLCGLPRIGVGDYTHFEFAPGAEGTAVELDVARVEPLVILAESFEADVRVRVEDAEGKPLAEDDDSGVETNALLSWTPSATGRWRVVVATRSEPPAQGGIRVLRGSPDLAPPDPVLAARAYWERALDAARWKKDMPRVETAIARLMEFAQETSREAFLKEDEAHVARVRAVLDLESRAREADRAGARADARRQVGEAAKLIEELDPAARDAAGEVLRRELSVLAFQLGDPRLGESLAQGVARHRERILGPDHPYLHDARMNVAVYAQQLGRAGEARAAFESVHAAFERVLPESHLALQMVRINLVDARESVGDFAGARELCVRTAAALENLPDGDDPSLWQYRGVISHHLIRLREMQRARSLMERVLAHEQAQEPVNTDRLSAARLELSVALEELGDLGGALSLARDAVADLEKDHPDTHPTLLAARRTLGSMLAGIGDMRGARALFEEVLSASEASMPEENQDLQAAREHLATVLIQTGDGQGAIDLLERVVEAESATNPAESPSLLRARVNLSAALERAGRHAEARDLLEQLLEAREKSSDEDDPLLHNVRGALGRVFSSAGEFAAARPLLEKSLEGVRRSFAADHPTLSQSLTNLAVCLAAQDEKRRLAEVLEELARCATERLSRAAVLSPREASEAVAFMDSDISVLLSLAPGVATSEGRPPLAETIFELLETRRAIAARDDPPGWTTTDDPRIASLRAEVSAARSRVAGLAGSAGAADALAAAVRERDRAEIGLRSALAAGGNTLVPIRSADLAARLRPGEVAVGFHRYTRLEPGAEALASLKSVDSLVALVVAHDGGLRRVELGPMSEVVAAVDEWRSALGTPVLARGMPAGGPRTATDARPAGDRLRRILVDPIRSGATGLVLCLDDALHLVPLDALPAGAESDEVVGDSLRVLIETSFRERVAPTARHAGTGFVELGDVDYGAEGRAPERMASLAPPLERGGEGDRRFAPLPGTKREVLALKDLYVRAFDVQPTVLDGAGATKAVLSDKAPGARFVHLATHGYFTPETVVPATSSNGGWQRSGLGRAAAELSPLVLCGLALAGADRGPDSLGHVPGILTAEEVAGMDLSRCELAVLSACETNVGIARAGRGIQSLQAALQAAGARTAVTSLWRVDDARTRELMEEFYTRVWIGKEPKATALWNAKASLRKKAAPTRDWAGWILTGSPD